MGSALLNSTTRDATCPESIPPVAPHDARTDDALRRQVAERLAAHRTRRARAGVAETRPLAPRSEAQANDTARARVASAVAERYAHAQSYRAFLAAEAERAIQQARAAAEVAARTAQAVVEAQLQLLDALAREQAANPPTPSHGPEPMLWADLEPVGVVHPAPARTPPAAGRTRHAKAADPPPASDVSVPRNSGVSPHGGLRVVLYEEMATSSPLSSATRSTATPAGFHAALPADDSEARALDEEISFRQAPVFEEAPGPPTPLPANLLEFPRQLIASRKARPRYAEGPLREDDAPAASGSQLRIFEVEPAQISTAPDLRPAAEAPEPQWTSLWLDTAPNPRHSSSRLPDLHPSAAIAAEAIGSGLTASYSAADTSGLPCILSPARPQTAATSRRILSAALDTTILFAATLGFAAAFATVAGRMADPSGPWTPAPLLRAAQTALVGLPAASVLSALAAAFALLGLAYQLLFFTFADSTPGMRAARVGLCTFSDDNPTRRAMRLRVAALVLSTVTLGLGYLWAVLDEDGLTWHDLISRMYQRSY